MSRHSRFVIPSVVLLVVLVLSLALTTAAYADDGTPPPVIEELVQPPVEEPVVSEQSSVASDQLSGKEAASDEPTPTEEVTVAEVLEAALEGTEVVVLDVSGGVLPLATEEAAEIVQSGDPMWCPQGVLPGDIVNGCTDPGWDGASYTNYNPTSLASLLSYLDANEPTVDGVIWIEDNYDSSENDMGVTNFGLNGSTSFSTMSLHDLTIQGGWTGDLLGTIDHNNPSLFWGASLRIVNWGADVTVNDIEIVETSATGLVVNTSGDIELNYVSSFGNSDRGARLNNTAGSGNVLIQNSDFGGDGELEIPGNGEAGLHVESNGNITLSNVVSNWNWGRGAALYTVGDVSVENSTFNENDRDGLLIEAYGDITLSNVFANDNRRNGATLDNCPGEGTCDQDVIVSISNSSFDGNTSRGADMGLGIRSMGSVTLNEVSASNNGAGDGADIFDFSSLFIQNSTFNNNSSDEEEWGYGLYIGGPGDITLQNVEASGNGLGEPPTADGAHLYTEGNITIICSQFKNNGDLGIDAWGMGEAFTLNDVTFSDNGGGDYDYDGTPNILSGGCKVVNTKNGNKDEASASKGTVLPLHIVPVGGGEKVDLDCVSYRGTKLILPSGDSVILPCPTRDDGHLIGMTLSDLPGQLPGYTFISAMEAKVMQNGEPLGTTNGVVVDFFVPADKQGADLTILCWNGSEWIDLGGSYFGDHFVVETNYIGFYVLVEK